MPISKTNISRERCWEVPGGFKGVCVHPTPPHDQRNVISATWTWTLISRPTPPHDQRNIISITWTWTLTSHPTPPHDQRNIISVTWTWTSTSHPTPPHHQTNTEKHKKRRPPQKQTNTKMQQNMQAPCSAHGNYIIICYAQLCMPRKTNIYNIISYKSINRYYTPIKSINICKNMTFCRPFLQRGQSTTLDFKSAAAMPEFNLVDPLAHVSGKKAVAGWSSGILRKNAKRHQHRLTDVTLLTLNIS